MGVSSQRHAPAAWSPEKSHGVPCEEVCVGFQIGLKCLEQKKYFVPKGIRSPNINIEGLLNVYLFLVAWLC
jgi:hypothetical protein